MIARHLNLILRHFIFRLSRSKQLLKKWSKNYESRKNLKYKKIDLGLHYYHTDSK